MEYFIIGLASFFVSGLTLYSGFGVGTLLLPFFALFFPTPIAIASTAVVHLLNNLFKLFLVGKYADKKVAVIFGLPAVLSAFLGTWVLIRLSSASLLFSYRWMGHDYEVVPVKLVIAILIAVFAFFELLPKFRDMSFQKEFLPFGGILSGFFGGLSGHQGALRSAFLIKSGLTKEVFIGTGVVVSCFVDFVRIPLYGIHFASGISDSGGLVLAATLCAFAGTWCGSRLLKRVTIQGVRVLVGILLFLIALGMGLGMV